jgi:decaprenylphospho-beta-D-erythro-pentofuranosid-2-ulose 2-reductase
VEKSEKENGSVLFLAIRSVKKAGAMLNALKQLQNILVIGGKSEIALETIRNSHMAVNAKVFLLGRNIESEDISIERTQTFRVNYDISDSVNRIELLSQLFNERDFDLVLVAVGFLGYQPNLSTLSQNQEVLNLNFIYSAEVLEFVAHRLKVQKHGKVLILSSVATVRPRKGNYVYGAAKAGLDFLARGLQLDLEGSGAMICIARLGFVHSRMTDGMKPAPFAISTQKAGKLCAKGITTSNKVFYVPGVLKFVMFIVRVLPTKILNRLP